MDGHRASTAGVCGAAPITGLLLAPTTDTGRAAANELPGEALATHLHSNLLSATDLTDSLRRLQGHLSSERPDRALLSPRLLAQPSLRVVGPGFRTARLMR